MIKLNCWEVKKCGRELGGEKVSELGVCPVAIEIIADGINNGKNAGRMCWTISGTLIYKNMQSKIIEKFNNCIECPFYKLVLKEEGENCLFSKCKLVEVGF